MRRHNRFFAVSLSVLFLAACGSDSADEAPADSADSADTQEAPPVAAVSSLSCAGPEDAAERPSPLSQVSFTYEGGEGLLCYGAPSANGREVVGGLVPFGEPWRLGANEATTFHLSAATTIGGVSLEAGSYSFYAIPGETEWEFFLNSNAARWGIPIDSDVRSTEVGSFRANPETLDQAVETLSFDHMGAVIAMSWENTRLNIPVGGM